MLSNITRKAYWVSITLIFITYIIYTIVLFMYCHSKNENTRDVKIRHQNTSFIIDTVGCRIPRFDPFDPEVRKLYQHPKNSNCVNENTVATANQTHVMINMTKAIEIYGEKVVCGYKRIRKDTAGLSDDSYDIETSYLESPSTMLVKDEFINIGCGVDREVVYIDFFPFIQVKKDVEKRCKKYFKKWVRRTKKRVVERFSVTFLGVDSVSKLNMLRHMPKTFNYLVNVMNAIDLKGFTKVADNTFVNVVPMLTGMFVHECWNVNMIDESFDYLNIIWKDFSDKGYRTLFAEDFPEIAIFNYKKSGFFKQPTDYYLRPFTVAATLKMGINDGCYNNRSEVDVVLQWLSDFLDTFKGKPTFSLTFNSRLTHDYLNNAGLADEPYYNFLNKFHRSNFSDNNILVFFSDHGMRFGRIRETYVGKIEERMPFFFLVFPTMFKSKYPKIWANLKLNENRLTTPFDIYATLKDVLHFTGKVEKGDLKNRGISLFKEIPEERTCENAAIKPHWCTCEERNLANVDDVTVRTAAIKLVEFINKKISGESKCAKLKLDAVKDARISGLKDGFLRLSDDLSDLVNQRVIGSKGVKEIRNYLITISVEPSQALFEGTVYYDERTEMYIVYKEISRINVYGHQSSCIGDEELQKFCYCK